MSDKGEQKGEENPTVPKPIPDITVTDEGATGGMEEDGRKSRLGALAGMIGKGISLIGSKRSKSKSPEPKAEMGGESSKGSSKMAKSSPSPVRKFGNFVHSLLHPKGSERKGEESENLCEEEVVPHSDKQQLAPPEPDQGFGTSPSTEEETKEDKCETYDKSTSVSSPQSDYSSLPNDDGDTDNVTSPDDLDSPEGERK